MWYIRRVFLFLSLFVFCSYLTNGRHPPAHTGRVGEVRVPPPRPPRHQARHKSSFFITVIVAVATIFVPIIPFSKLTGFFKNTEGNQEGFAVLFLILLVISFVFLANAFLEFYKAYKLTEYLHPNLEMIDTKENHMAEQEIVNKALCDHYKEIVDGNREVNDNKCVHIASGLSFCGIGFLLLVATTIALLVIM